MRQNIFVRALLPFIGLLLLGLLPGCSEKIVNDTPDIDGDLVIDIQASPQGIEQAVQTYRLTVSGPDMDPIVAELSRIPNTSYVAGALEVPAGLRRLFVLEGIGGLIGGEPVVLYRGQTVAAVRPGVVTVLDIQLRPVAPIVKLTPSYSDVFPGDPLVLDLKVFNINGMQTIQVELQWSDTLGTNPSVEFSSDFTNEVMTDYWTEGSYLGLTVAGNWLTDMQGDVTLARITLQPLTLVAREFGLVRYPFDVNFSEFNPVHITTVNGDTLTQANVFLEPAHVLVYPRPDQIVVFPDQVLDRVVRDLDTIPQGTPILMSDIQDYYYLNVGDLGVGDLTGLEYMVNLYSLQVSWNYITDLTPLTGLTRLTSLSAELNQISDISPLAGLVNLGTLEIGANMITDISPLAGLERLSWVELQGNQIVDLTPLENLPDLYYLDLNSNLIEDITPLVNNLGLGSGDTVVLWGNQALPNNPNFTTHVATLRERGVTVFLTPPVN